MLTAADLGYMAKHGIDFRLKKESCFFIRGLDSQREKGKAIFGGGFLLSEKATAEKAAAEKAAAEKAAAEKAAAEKWGLSEREWNIIKSLEGETKEGKKQCRQSRIIQGARREAIGQTQETMGHS